MSEYSPQVAYEQQPGTLVVRSADPLTEIRIIDHRFRTVGTGVGAVRTSVTEGLYKVKFRSADQSLMKIVEVRGGRETRVSGEYLEFDTAAPYVLTRSAREAQLRVAISASETVHVKAGKGARILMFMRDASAADRKIPSNACRLLDSDSELLAQVGDGYESEEWACSACTVDVSPGEYQLEVPESVGRVRLSLHAARGWETHVFMTIGRGSFSANKSDRAYAKLSLASVMMTPLGRGVELSRACDRAAEQARLSLIDGRRVVSLKNLLELAHLSADNPMLLVYALAAANRDTDSRPSPSFMNELGRIAAVLPPLPDLSILDTRIGSETIVRTTLIGSDYKYRPPLLWENLDWMTGELARERGGLVVQRGPFAGQLLEDSVSEQRMEKKRPWPLPSSLFERWTALVSLLLVEEGDREEYFRSESSASLDPMEQFVLAASLGWENVERQGAREAQAYNRVAQIVSASTYSDIGLASAARRVLMRMKQEASSVGDDDEEPLSGTLDASS